MDTTAIRAPDWPTPSGEQRPIGCCGEARTDLQTRLRSRERRLPSRLMRFLGEWLRLIAGATGGSTGSSA
jgi:hypothetical protein